MKTTFRIEGLKDLDTRLGQFKASTAKNVLRRAGREALEPFDAAWRVHAPVRADGPERQGDHLKDTGDVGSKISASQRSAHRRESTVEVFAGPGPDPQAIQQEFGNRNHPPQPFVRPAWDATKDEVAARVKDALAAEIEKTARRLATSTKG